MSNGSAEGRRQRAATFTKLKYFKVSVQTELRRRAVGS